MFQTPVLLITFNRPIHTRKVFDAIKQVKPARLFIFQDGPRANNPSDYEKCEEVKRLINNEINWECELKTLYSDVNLGCGYGPVKAIDWFFENENYGIILEDDCVASSFFFEFCEKLLNKYRNDERVWMISGMNRMERWRPYSCSYFFTRHGSTWGWASYRRAWKHFKHDIPLWFKQDGKEKISKLLGHKEYLIYERNIEVHCSANRLKDVWDYQWHFTRLYYSGLTIVPSVNLVKNIGLDLLGTHTLIDDPIISSLKVFQPQKLKIADDIQIDRIYDWVYFNRFENPEKMNLIKKIVLKSLRYMFKLI